MIKFAQLFLLLSIFSSIAQTKINMKSEGNGIYSIPCKVNGLPLKFIFDTGASNVTISLSEAIFMIKNGLLNENDIIGTSYSQIANGQITENTKIILREIEIQGLKLYDVSASVIHELNAPLLMGQSAIQKLGKIQLNGNELTIFNGDKTNSDCDFDSIIPFQIGMSDFDISLFILKNPEYEIDENHIMKIFRHSKEYVDYLNKEVNTGRLVIRKKLHNCINTDITFDLYLVDDFIYKILVDFGENSEVDAEETLKNYEFIKTIIPKEYSKQIEYYIGNEDKWVNIKTGEGIRFLTEEGYNQYKNKKHDKFNYISISYRIEKKENEDKGKLSVKLEIVDLRKTVLSNKRY